MAGLGLVTLARHAAVRANPLSQTIVSGLRAYTVSTKPGEASGGIYNQDTSHWVLDELMAGPMSMY